MLEFHEDFETPTANETVWRFMSFNRFIDLISSASLWFSKCDGFIDGWEGRFTSLSKERFMTSFKGEIEKISSFYNHFEQLNTQMRDTVYINCWHMSRVESAAFWQIYDPGKKAIGIRSTVRRIRDALAKTNVSIFAGRVSYYDPKVEPVPVMENMLTPFLRKRHNFDFERELRLVHWQSESMAIDASACPGVRIPISVARLLEQIYISPFSEECVYLSTVEALTQHGLSDVKVVVSDLFRFPK